MMPAQGQPIILVAKQGTEQESGKTAQKNNIKAARAVADAVRSTLGPKGMDKMLVDAMGDVVITNDGVTILKEIDVEHPAAKMIVEVAKTQDTECGDGTTTAVILAGELLKNAEALIEQNVHPTIITHGYQMAMEKSIEVLRGIGEDVTIDDSDTLGKIARTAMTGKSAENERDRLSEIAVKAVQHARKKDNIKMEKMVGSSVNESELITGIIMSGQRTNGNMPERVKDAKVALLTSALEIKKTEVDAKIQINDPGQLQAFLDEEERMVKKMTDAVIKSGATVLVCQKGIDDLADHYLAKKGVFAVKRAKAEEMSLLSKATGAKVVAKPDDLSSDTLGSAGLVEEKEFGTEKLVFFTKCKDPKAVTIFIRGGTEHVIDEVERALVDAVSVVSVAAEDGKVTVGAGSAAMEISIALRDYAIQIGGREQMAIEKFADSIEVVPRVLAENAGLDAIDVLIDLRKAHKAGHKAHGVNVYNGTIEDMRQHNVLEPLRVGVQALTSATETSIMILRIDDIIAAKKGQPQRTGPTEMPSNMM